MKLQTCFVYAVVLSAVSLLSCYPTGGPDKSITGAVLGAGWGAGAGAVVGHQVNSTGPGAAIGAGFGAGAGLLTGVGLDVAEGTELEQQRQIDALKVQVAANRLNMSQLQDNLDSRGKMFIAAASDVDVFFDEDRASIRGGSAAELERFCASAKLNPYVKEIQLHGHSDDTGDSTKNQQLAEARVRTVQTFLVEHGVSSDRIKVFSHAATRPLATNQTPVGRQLNRRVEVVVVR